MTKLHRKELKQDEIREKVSEAVHSVSVHGREVLYVVAIVLVVGCIAAAWFYYEKKQDAQSQDLLGMAMDKLNATVGPEPVNPVNKTTYHYKTESEKYTAALKDFDQVVRRYGNTNAANMARYQAGICAFYLKDFPKAEKYLKDCEKVPEKNILFYESRIALANVYNNTGKSDQAVSTLKEILDRNQNQVPPEYLLMEAAESYEKAGKKKEAADSYQKILSQYKDSPISYQAQLRLSEMRAK